MLTFMLVYFGIYGSMHAYFFFKCHQACGPEGTRQMVLAVFLLLMLNGPILVRFLERKEMTGPATLLAYISYTWMAFLLWFLFLSLTRDLWNTGVRLIARTAPSAYSLVIPPKPALFVILTVILAATAWSFFEARALKTERVTIETSRLEPGSTPLKVAQISDVHFGLLEHRRRMDQISSIVEREKPDLLLCTGDLLDGMAMHVNDLSSRLAAIQPPLGKYAVTGNHEFYVGLKTSLRFLEDAGFRVLRGESVLAGPLRLTGVDDPAGKHTGQASYTREETALDMFGEEGRFTILLKHQPLTDPTSVGRFDLQVSGHTHKGQIYPFNYPVKMRYRYIAGLYDLAMGSRIYTSRGTGTWGPPLRLFSPPEVTIFILKSET